MPDDTIIGQKDNGIKSDLFSYLMLFTDGNRIDLTLFPIDKLEKEFKKDSLTVVLLDKDELFTNLPNPDDRDYLIKSPIDKEFLDCCNEFWWVNTYVAKGLYRNQITYAKEMLEVFVRPMFFKMIEWHIGINTNFSVSFGKAGKFMKEHIAPAIYQKILSTYPDAIAENVWKSLFAMTELFSQLAVENASGFQL